MNEKEKTVHADEFEGNRTNSTTVNNGQHYYTGNSNDFQNLALRALVKIVELLESLHGEIHLQREASEKTVSELKKIAVSLEHIEGDLLAKNDLLSEMSGDVEGIHSCTSVCRAMTIRISNGLQAVFPKFKDSFKV